MNLESSSIDAEILSDKQLIDLWLYGRSEHTQRAYRTDTNRLVKFIGNKSLHNITLADLQEFSEGLGALSACSKARILSSIKSLLTFGQRSGYLQFNIGAALLLPSVKNTLAERILTETEVYTMIALETNPRNKALIKFMYSSGARVSEVCGLKWKDCLERDNAGQVTLYGKGGKTRIVLLSEGAWKDIQALKGDSSPDDPVFRSRQARGHLSTRHVTCIIRKAAARAGIKRNVSPHWLRHSHASHALDRKCPIHLVQATLGHASVATTGKYLHARPDDSSAKYLGI